MRIYFHTQDETLDIRGFNNASKAAMFDVGMVFEQEVKPTKFEQPAERVYFFQPRSPLYVKIQEEIGKRSYRTKLVGGRKASLVSSGITRTAVKRPSVPRASAWRVTVALPTPSYIKMRPNQAGQPNLGEELTSVTDQHVRTMERRYLQRLESEVQQRVERRARRIG